ncbi:metallophosphoesterase [Listeria kieliensis]
MAETNSQLTTQLHTIFLFFGDTSIEALTFIEQQFMPALRNDEPSKNYYTTIQFFPDTNQTSFLNDLNKSASFPTSADYILIHMGNKPSDSLQESIQKIAKENQYQLEAVYLNQASKPASDHFANQHTLTLPISNFSIESNGDQLKKYLLEPGKTYHIIGDTHECLQELMTLLEKSGFRFNQSGRITERPDPSHQFILLGDSIDKGKNTKAILEFLYLNLEHFYFVIGNHESFVYHYLQGKIKNANKEIVSRFFDSIPILEENPDLLAKFHTLVEHSAPFYKLISNQASFYATHAPCKNKYLGKLDKKSLRRMRNFHLDRSRPTEEQLLFLLEEANENHPYHFFGHVAAKNAFRLKNKIHLDTGCIHGNLLTEAVLTPTGKVTTCSIPSHHQDDFQAQLPLLFQ